MAQYMKGAALYAALCCPALVLLLAGSARAQELPDPTRPPALTAQSPGAPVTPAGPVLQSIMIFPSRAEAVISGRLVHVGDTVGNGRIIKIAETDVVLQTSAGLRTMKLFPSIEKYYSDGRPAAITTTATMATKATTNAERKNVKPK